MYFWSNFQLRKAQAAGSASNALPQVSNWLAVMAYLPAIRPAGPPVVPPLSVVETDDESQSRRLRIPGVVAE